MAFQVFTVLTEFKFDAAGAIATSDQLTGAVDGISQAADRTLKSMQSMGVGILSSFLSGPGGGILGVLGTALFSFDKFYQSQIQFANILGANGQSFTNNLMLADEILEDINEKALKFGLPTGDLANVVKLIAPQLMTKGLAGENLSGATNLGRSFLKASPILGIDPQEAFGQLQRAIEGQASGGDTMFNRLAGETKAMQAFVGNAKAFNQLNPAARLAKLNLAFGQFANNTEAVDARMNSLTGQMQILKNQLTGAFSVLRPFGKALNDVILPALQGLNDYVRDNLSVVIKNVTRMFKEMAPNMGSLFVNLMALRELKNNFLNVGHILKLVGGFLLVRTVMHIFGLSLMSFSFIVTGAVRVVGMLITGLTTLVGWLGGFWAVLNGIVVVISTILAPLVALMLVFQILSRVSAMVQAEFGAALAYLAPIISDISARFTAIWGVFQEGMNVIAAVITAFIPTTIIVEKAVGLMDILSQALGMAVAGFQGLAFAILEFVNQIKSLVTGGGFDATKIGTSYNAGVDQMLQRIFGFKGEDSALPTSSPVTNIGKLEINQDFKQQQEPDRIAFTVADTLMKLARNPTQAANGGFATSGVGR